MSDVEHLEQIVARGLTALMAATTVAIAVEIGRLFPEGPERC